MSEFAQAISLSLFSLLSVFFLGLVFTNSAPVIMVFLAIGITYIGWSIEDYFEKMSEGLA